MSEHERPTRHLPGHAKRFDPTTRRDPAATAATETSREHAVADIVGRDLMAVLKKAAKKEGNTVLSLVAHIVREWLSDHGYLEPPESPAAKPPAAGRARRRG